MSAKVHYAGGLTWVRAGQRVEMAAGYPACVSGYSARTLKDKGRIAYSRVEGTCAHCRVRLAWADAAKAAEARNTSSPVPQLTLMRVKVDPETQARASANALCARLDAEALVDLLLLLQRYPDMARDLLERELATYLKKTFPQYFMPHGLLEEDV